MPWLSWAAAVVVLILVGEGVTTPRLAPGEAERRVVPVAASSAAIVEEVKVQPGQPVRAGELLAVLHAPGLDRELGQALAELERASLSVGAQRTILEDDTRTTRFRLAREAEEAALQLARLESEAERNRAELQQVQEQVTRQTALVAQRLASSRLLEELQVRQAALGKAVEDSDGLLAAARSHERAARSRLQAAQPPEAPGGAGAPDRRLQPLEAATRVQEERVASLQEQITRLQVRAPVEAVVASVDVPAGASAAAGQAVITLVPATTRRVVAWLDETQVPGVALGDAAELRPRTHQAVRTGRVVALGPGLVEGPTWLRLATGRAWLARPVYIELDGGEGTLPGSTFEVRFLEEARP